jgi:hypothetical protein
MLMCVGTPVQSETDFWELANDHLFRVLVNDGDPSPLIDHFDSPTTKRRGATIERAQSGGEPGAPAYLDLLYFSGEGAELALFLTGVDFVPAGFVLNFTSDDDATIMGLRGSLSNCSEVTEATCDRVGLQLRSEMTLGVTACVCDAKPLTVSVEGDNFVLLPCYLGRGGTYMDWLFAFGPLDDGDAKYLGTANEADLAGICAASSAALAYPQYLLGRSDAASDHVLPERVDPDAKAQMVVATSEPDISPLALFQYVYGNQQVDQ